MHNDFKDIVFNRHSVKLFDENFKINHDEMLEMIKEATKAPSSVNMQPWRFLVVESEEAKKTLRPLIRFNTRQNDTSSAMIIIFGDMKCYEKGEQIYSETVKQGYMPEDVKKELMDVFMPEYMNASREKMNDIVKIDSSLAAMQLMLVARAHGYETNPIGGFEGDKLAKAFNLDEERYVPVIIIAIGKGIEEPHKSIRLNPEEITMFK
ncbi:putative NAD(P)H nitroreductase YodC [Fusobacterium sp. DD29]|uniref:nitroreductase family protein n=1 Tax=unclassified Fusobacterium TaxID=2648384 RepID=UPI001B8BAA54|nr:MULTISPECIES: nitroreductase family protein [unclassified Fusobacterium]MBR8701679.1 putative NAD(P)H nitroreductase YodC [Fusobacterium sp. DD45]MBR8711471.1 putative NAD(P)H nitroreductase YodC [Fusobacterium sp. DD28]MBR8749798.1 putative NAD(P)H nitroreductase YodC [Fusobacterium sp. DD29]MBR8752009.1 putative NAD(P)H nitroreductase YodC [Fusobacterium sp. DD26]MBR8762040.1 putative NAD(P)H nitroreductase YodC [Fusobacterium sp. DD25]